MRRSTFQKIDNYRMAGLTGFYTTVQLIKIYKSMTLIILYLYGTVNPQLLQ